MLYATGETLELGDTVLTEGRVRAVVVGLIAEGRYSPPYAAADWDYLGSGVMVEADDAGLIIYDRPQEVWTLLSRS